MMPLYRNMDSYPFHRNQIPCPYPHYYHPNMEYVPPQMTKSAFPYEQPWPYARSYAPHFCYSHIPCYPPHVPSPSPMFYSGGVPSLCGPYSPYYSMEVPRYEYDKYMPKDHHCCGCSNHSCNQKEERNVSIEEQKPNVGKKENDAMEFRNFPYPLVCIPPEYYGNTQMKGPAGMDEQDRMSHDKKLAGAEDFNPEVQRAVEPRLWNGWLPFDVKGARNISDGDGIRSTKKEGDDNVIEYGNGKMDQKHQSEQQKRSEFPFPLIWFPSYYDQQDGGRTNNQKSYSAPAQEGVEEVPHTFKSVPVKSCADEGVIKRTNSNDVESKDRSAFDVTEKVSNQRSIPVKQIESNHMKNNSMESNVLEENVAKKESHSVSKRRSASPTKGSKLPPVCLRVDPLPRKKNGNGKSRSLSPPALRERSKEIACEPSNTSSDSMTDQAKLCSTIQVSQNKTNENMTANSEIHEGGKEERRVLSDADAAVVIQTVYRGYLVRKSEPLKKLRQIGEVSKEVTYVKDRIEAFGDSSNLQIDDKEKLAIGETIMRLLLKLDTIQGLHPSLREIRKSLARELVTLQEKLDSITVKNSTQQQIQESDPKKHLEISQQNVQNGENNQEQQEEKVASLKDSSQEQMQDLDAKKHLEISLQNVLNEEHNQEQQEEKVASQKDSSEGISDGKPQDQFCMMDVEGVGESQSHVGSGSANLDISPVVSVDAMDSTSNSSDKMDMELESVEVEVDKLNMNAFKELPVGVIDEDTIEDYASERLDSDMDAMKELPVGVIDEDTTEDSASERLDSEMLMKELPVGVLDEDAATSEETNTVENEVIIKELPVELLDENAEKSEAERSEYKEKPLVEEKEGVQSSEESDGWVKVEFQKQDDELKVDAPVDTEESGEENENDSKLPSLGIEEANDVANIMLNENEPEEKLAQQETHLDVQESVAGETNRGDDKNTETLAKEEIEQSVDLSVTKHNAELNGNMMLLEENEKLRKMMKELLEAGTEQLSVISNLTGRVKDLEKKLAKSRKTKKVKTKRHRSVTPKVSPKVSCHYSTD